MRQDEIVTSSLLTVNFPYTSSKIFSETMRIPSVFFFPCIDGEEVFASNGPFAVITDQKRLSELICLLKQKNGN